ncbi:MAG: prepilin-type N-terminal cleavage/methylation domain-containing protein [Oligoflexales bacterium]|nr:prepilin-type N-terminal cleavage/methylation domain-containing protein [Oligoflexales bacterium]
MEVVSRQNNIKQRGFTLLEVVFTIGILLSISIAATNLIRGSLTMKSALSQRALVNHRLSTAMQRVVNDLTHMFIVNSMRQEYNYVERATKTIFKIDQNGENTELAFTTMTHVPKMANANESDQTYVVYQLKEDEKNRKRTNLYRGETKILPEDFKDEIPMKLLAENIKTFKVMPWNGEKWSQDRWNTSRSDFRNMLPHMVKIEITAWDEDMEPDETTDKMEDILTKIATVVYLPQTIGQKEMKEPPKTLNWEF